MIKKFGSLITGAVFTLLHFLPNLTNGPNMLVFHYT
jgi:hypothetical protein